ncbi:MAG: hypothetical protein IT437_07715 [Phycisphaerales bacterium]|nr:hypothetical protein [Phycisphaerales bacterium]
MLTTPLALAVLLAAPPPPFDLDARVKETAAAHAGLARVTSLGKSRHGRDIPLLRLARDEGDVPADERPALVIIAGANAMHRVGIETALRVAEKLAGEHAEQLKDFTVYVVPCLNPDGLAYATGAEHPASDFGRTIAPFDADHDGRVNEDPGEDLNGDGYITVMRVENLPPGSLIHADSVTDPDSPKLVRRADAAKGEHARYALLTEGIDNDNDGRFNEDGAGGTAGGGVDLDLNTPYRWPEFSDGAGPYEFSEPESLALARWMLARTNLVAAVFYGPHDNLVKVPDAGRYDEAGGVPLGIENGDKAAYEDLSKAFKDITKMTAAPSNDNAGSLWGWSYAMVGVYSFTTPVWVRPDQLKQDKPADAEKKVDGASGERPPGDRPARRGRPGDGGTPPRQPGTPPPALPVSLAIPDDEQPTAQPVAQPPAQPTGQPGRGGGGNFRGGGRFPGGFFGGGGQNAPSSSRAPDSPDDAKWVTYSDEKRDGKGFLDWKPFDHPQLGKVEIGGFVPGFRMNPPEEDLPRLADEQAKFASALLDKFPRIGKPTTAAVFVAPGIWRISVRAVNDGFLPLQSAMAGKARRVPPARFSIDVPVDRILVGQKIVRFPAVAGGAAAEAQWVVRVPDGEAVNVHYAPVTGGDRVIEVRTLKVADRPQEDAR